MPTVRPGSVTRAVQRYRTVRRNSARSDWRKRCISIWAEGSDIRNLRASSVADRALPGVSVDKVGVVYGLIVLIQLLLPPRIAKVARLGLSQASHAGSRSWIIHWSKVAFDLSLPTRYAGLVNPSMLDGPRRGTLVPVLLGTSSGDAPILVLLSIGGRRLLGDLLKRRHRVWSLLRSFNGCAVALRRLASQNRTKTIAIEDAFAGKPGGLSEPSGVRVLCHVGQVWWQRLR